MSPACNKSTVLQRFERGNVLEIRSGIMFDFYPGLPHMYFVEVPMVAKLKYNMVTVDTLKTNKDRIDAFHTVML